MVATYSCIYPGTNREEHPLLQHSAKLSQLLERLLRLLKTPVQFPRYCQHNTTPSEVFASRCCWGRLKTSWFVTQNNSGVHIKLELIIHGGFNRSLVSSTIQPSLHVSDPKLQGLLCSISPPSGQACRSMIKSNFDNTDFKPIPEESCSWLPFETVFDP